MDQFSIHIHANNSPTSVEFVEKNYKLNAGETLVGKDDDFPVKKNLSFYTDWEYTEGEISPVTPTNSAALRTIDLTSWINGAFPSLNEALPDKGLTVEMEFFFFMNHWFEREVPESTNEQIHYSLTANLLTRFNILKTNLNTFFISNFKNISATGKWVKYGFTVDGTKILPYASILASGDLKPSVEASLETPDATTCFKVLPDVLSNTTVKLIVSNLLRTNTAFSNLPDYIAKVKYKVRILNYDQEDHTHEYQR